MKAPPKQRGYQIKARLSLAEKEMLDHLCNPKGGTKTKRNPSELIRLLIVREFQKSTAERNGKGWAEVPDRLIATDWRRGRPKKESNEIV